MGEILEERNHLARTMKVVYLFNENIFDWIHEMYSQTASHSYMTRLYDSPLCGFYFPHANWIIGVIEEDYINAYDDCFVSLEEIADLLKVKKKKKKKEMKVEKNYYSFYIFKLYSM